MSTSGFDFGSKSSAKVYLLMGQAVISSDII